MPIVLLTADFNFKKRFYDTLYGTLNPYTTTFDILDNEFTSLKISLKTESLL